MEWKSERIQLQLTRVAGPAESRLNYIVYLRLLSHRRSFMSKLNSAVMPLYPRMDGTSTVASSSGTLL